MDKMNVEITQLKKADNPQEEGKGGKLETMKPDEAGGRARYTTIAQCSVCGFIGTVTVDTAGSYYITCNNCNAVLRVG
ncbi:MAG: hypothetical protein M3Y69_09315 [Verrucomicrobiota bacterium]|nr:hypothetical protein [Verrucomicrobiota bacterium]